MSWWRPARSPAARRPAAGCSRKQALDRWVMAGLIAGQQFAQATPPPIVGGSHDPLLEWALRESGSGLAYLPEGSEAGLRRLVRGEVMAAAIHLHRLEGDDERANIDAAASDARLARRRGDRLRAARTGIAGRARQSEKAHGHRLGRGGQGADRTTHRRRRRAASAAVAAGSRRAQARPAERAFAALRDRRGCRRGGAHRPRRLRHRHPLGRARGRRRFSPARPGSISTSSCTSATISCPPCRPCSHSCGSRLLPAGRRR